MSNIVCGFGLFIYPVTARLPAFVVESAGKFQHANKIIYSVCMDTGLNPQHQDFPLSATGVQASFVLILLPPSLLDASCHLYIPYFFCYLSPRPIS
jgi:hypothetical protein